MMLNGRDKNRAGPAAAAAVRDARQPSDERAHNASGKAIGRRPKARAPTLIKLTDYCIPDFSDLNFIG